MRRHFLMAIALILLSGFSVEAEPLSRADPKAILLRLEALYDSRIAMERETGDLTRQHRQVTEELSALKRQQEADYSLIRRFRVNDLSDRANELSGRLTDQQKRLNDLREQAAAEAAPLLNLLAGRLVAAADRAAGLTGTARESAEHEVLQWVRAIDALAARYGIAIKDDRVALVIPRLLLREDMEQDDDMESLMQKRALIEEVLDQAEQYRENLEKSVRNNRTRQFVKSILQSQNRRRSVFGLEGQAADAVVRNPGAILTEENPTSGGSNPDSTTGRGNEVEPPSESPTGSEGIPSTGADPPPPGEAPIDSEGGGAPQDTADPGHELAGAPPEVEAVLALSLPAPAFDSDPREGNLDRWGREDLPIWLGPSGGLASGSESVIYALGTDLNDLERQQRQVDRLLRDLDRKRRRLEKRIEELKSPPSP